MFRILHLSDLHFGKNCRFYDPDPNTSGESAAESIHQNLLSNHVGRIHAVIASGDFSWSNEQGEFDAARHFCHQLAIRLNLPMTDFVVIPGNHDVTWSRKSKTANEKFRYLLHDEAEKAYRKFFTDTIGIVPSKNLDYVRIFRGDKIAIIGLNSCRFYQMENAGLGYVGPDQIYDTIKALRLDPGYKAAADEFFKIAVLHHHLVPASDLQLMTELEKDPAERRFSLTIDATEILRLLMKDNFALILHGHLHVPFWGIEQRFPASRDGMPKKRIAIMAAGSFGVTADHCSYNHFQVIEIERATLIASGFESVSTSSCEAIVHPVRVSRRQLTTPKLRLDVDDRRLERNLLGHVRLRMEEESALLARVLLEDDSIKTRVFEAILSDFRSYHLLEKLTVADLRHHFDTVLSKWSKGTDPMRIFREEMKREKVQLHTFLLDLMEAYVAIGGH